MLEGIFPPRGKAYIRHIETAEQYAGSQIVIPAQARDKISRDQFLIVSVGDYEHCQDPEECPRPHHKGFMHKHRLMQGDWVLVRHRSWMATPDPNVYVVRVDDVLGKFEESVN